MRLLGDTVGYDHPKLSGFYPLADGVDAFVARLALIEAAQHTIDVQYYLYHRQQTTYLLTAYLLAAAERGVRVRLLLDDMSQADSEFDLGALAFHPNFEVRLFNPFPNRTFRALGLITNFNQLSRRMHNKSFIVDNQMFITGGRNIGNAYFAAEDRSAFIDLDVLSVGNVVPEASKAFELYWNHQLASSIEALRGDSDQQLLDSISKKLKAYLLTHEDSDYVKQLESSEFTRKLTADEIYFDWQQAELFYDHPDKLLNSVDEKSANMSPSLFKAMGEPEEKAVIVSPYFIPKDEGVDLLASWIKKGVNVTVLTNSLAATDVASVYAGYGQYRASLLRAGIKLWELKPREQTTLKNKKENKRLTGSSQSSLHAKTMAMDDKQIFVGSLNLDPRSFNLNTEMGVLIQSEKLSSMLSHWAAMKMPEYAWQLELKESESDEIIWRDMITGEVFTTEPKASSWRRFQAWFMSLFPIENVL